MLIYYLTAEDHSGTSTSLHASAAERDHAFAGWLAKQLKPGDPDDDAVASRLKAGDPVAECYQQWCETGTWDANAWTGEQEVALPVPRIIVCCDGGLVQEHFSDQPVELTVLDYDVDGADEADLEDIPQEDGTTAKGSLTDSGVCVNPARVLEIIGEP